MLVAIALTTATLSLAQFVGVFERQPKPVLAHALHDEIEPHRLSVTEIEGRLYAMEVVGTYRHCYVAVSGFDGQGLYFVEGPPTLYDGNATDVEIRSNGKGPEINVAMVSAGIAQTIFYDYQDGDVTATAMGVFVWQRVSAKPNLQDMFEIEPSGDKQSCLPSAGLATPASLASPPPGLDMPLRIETRKRESPILLRLAVVGVPL